MTATADRFEWRTRYTGRQIRDAVIHSPMIAWRYLALFFVGFSVLFGKWRDWATVAELTADIRANRAIAQKQGLQYDTKPLERRNLQATMRKRITLIVLVVIAIAGTVLYFLYRNHPYFPYVVGGTALAFFAVCEEVGKRYKAPEEGYVSRPRGAVEPGISYKKLQTWITEILRDEIKPPIQISFHGNNILPHGIEFEVHLTQTLTDAHLRTLEKHLQVGLNMVSLVRNRKNSAAPTLRVFWRDPLAGAVKPERRAPKSISCKDPLFMTRDDTGNRPGHNVYGIHQYWVGQSGSGKSSALWTLCDWLVDCKDADTYGIDVAGTVFAPYRRVLAGYATDEDAAVEILDAALVEYERRIALLNEGLDADDDGLLDENWVISEKKGDRAWFIILDEYKTIAQKHEAIRTRVEHLMEVGRKARIHIIISSPAADKASMKSTTPVNQSMAKVVFSIPFSMIAHVLGVGMSDDGWRPDRFEPGSPIDPADSGKVYIQSPGSPRPIVQRFDRLEPEDIRDRNRDRRAFVETRLPEPLTILKAAFAKAGNPPRLATATILEHPSAAGWDAESLAAALKELPVVVAPKPMSIDGTTKRGYELTGLQAAIKAVK